MYNMTKSSKTDMSVWKKFPNRNLKTMKKQKTKKSQKFTGKCYS